ncbi:hypothetical protein EVAR_41644_1 [Eumeta japonica]|uniref:Uncharacterized protein n=1 Tax=Eumeta variegata TaxID=151549 RepID=A0A4C1X3S0_EUMVA|nr:hypothetical protein EVAR_41644_1 [Eumeta japonica]
MKPYSVSLEALKSSDIRGVRLSSFPRFCLVQREHTYETISQLLLRLTILVGLPSDFRGIRIVSIDPVNRKEGLPQKGYYVRTQYSSPISLKEDILSASFLFPDDPVDAVPQAFSVLCKARLLPTNSLHFNRCPFSKSLRFELFLDHILSFATVHVPDAPLLNAHIPFQSL